MIKHSRIHTLMLAIISVVLMSSCGGGGSSAPATTTGTSSGSGSTTTPPPVVTPGITLMAGDLGGPGNLGGVGSASRFNFPTTMVMDGAGNIYVADIGDESLRRVTPAGVVSTVRSAYSNTGYTVDIAGNLYVVSGSPTNVTISKITPAGVSTTFANYNVPADPEGSGELNSVLAVDAAGNVYAAHSVLRYYPPNPDTTNLEGYIPIISFVQKITPNGTVTTLAGSLSTAGSSDGIGAAANFDGPAALALDGAGNLYVADTYNNAIRKITPAGAVSTLSAALHAPTGVAVDGSGNVYVADQGSHTIQKLTPSGTLSTVAGTANVAGSTDGQGTLASFNSPDGIVIDAAGNLVVSDERNNTLRKISPQGAVTTLAGLASPASIISSAFQPSGVVVDGSGNIYVGDTGSNVDDKITPDGTLSTFSNNVNVSAIDAAGNLYGIGNDVVLKISPAGVSTVLAGSVGSTGTTDGTGAAARFSGLYAMTVDSVGNLYVLDGQQNSTVIRKISPSGVVTTMTEAGDVNGLAVDGSGNLYTASPFTNTIDKIDPSGKVTNFAGNINRGSADGTGLAAGFYQPGNVATDRAGNIYVADTWNNTIRKITPTGTVTTVAGTAGSQGNQLGSLPGSLSHPSSLTVDSNGVLYVTSGSALLKIQLP